MSQVLPYPPDSGPQTRTHNVLKYLHQKQEITLVSFVRSEDELEHSARLSAYCESTHRSDIPDSATFKLSRPGFCAEDAGFVPCLGDGRLPRVSWHEALAVQAVVDAIYRSAQRKHMAVLQEEYHDGKASIQ